MIETIWREKLAILVVASLIALLAYVLSLPSAAEKCVAKGGHIVMRAEPPNQRPYPKSRGNSSSQGPYSVCEYD